MADDKNYWTPQQRPDGKWESNRKGGECASKVTETQADAWACFKESDGKAFLKRRDSDFRERNTCGKDRTRRKGSA